MPEVGLDVIFSLPIFYRALIAGSFIAILAGSLGVLVVVRGMSFFSDAIAHASLTGIALGLLLAVDPLIAAMAFSVLVGLGIAALSRTSTLGLDTIIGVFYSAAVALGVIIISSLRGIQVDLFGFLFGDILGVSSSDVLMAGSLTVLVLVLFAVIFSSVSQLALSRELAKVHGVKVTLVDFIFMALLAITVAIGIKLVGVILIGPLLIMPAATAKNLGRSLVSTLSISVVVSLVGFVSGLFVSVLLDIPSGPAIVLTMAFFFVLSLLLKPVRRA